MKKITFTISPDGTNIEVTAEGFAGKGCVETAKKYIDSLGSLESQKMTEDYYKKEQTSIKIS